MYQQIVYQFKMFILQARLHDGDEIPSRRTLAALLGVNPNTVQKAFSELENEGIIVTPPNSKSIVCVDDGLRQRLNAELLGNRVSELINMAKDMGVSYKRIIDLISESWDVDGEV